MDVLQQFETAFLARTAELLNLQSQKHQAESHSKDEQIAELTRQLMVITVPEHLETEMKAMADCNSQLTESLAESQLKVNDLTVSNQSLVIKVGGVSMTECNHAFAHSPSDLERELQLLREAGSSNGTNSFCLLQRQNQQLIKENRQLHDRILTLTDDFKELEQQHLLDQHGLSQSC